MVKRIIYTARPGTVDERGESVETTQEREVVRTLKEPGGVKVYDASRTLPDYYRPNDAVLSGSDGLAVLNSRLQAQEAWASQGSAALHDIDLRLVRVEEALRPWAARGSNEQTTWWALWGILMLLLGSTLAVIMLLIFSTLVH